MARKKKEQEVDQRLAYKTESELKEEALKRKRQQELIAARQKPKSERAKKAENFRYHYGKATVIGLLCVALAVLFVKDVFFKTEPDAAIVMVTSAYIPQEYLQELTELLEANTGDLNGDGEVHVSIDYMSYVPMTPQQLEDARNAQAALEAGEEADEDALNATSSSDPSITMKLMTVIAAASDPIYLLDQANYDYINAMSHDDEGVQEYEIFLGLESIPGSVGDALPLSSTVLADAGLDPYFTEELSFYFRELNVTKKNADYNANCFTFLEKLAK